MPTLRSVILAVVYAVVAYLICVFIGGLIESLGIPIASFVGGFLAKFAGVISVLVFIYYLFIGRPA